MQHATVLAKKSSRITNVRVTFTKYGDFDCDISSGHDQFHLNVHQSEFSSILVFIIDIIHSYMHYNEAATLTNPFILEKLQNSRDAGCRGRAWLDERMCCMVVCII